MDQKIIFSMFTLISSVLLLSSCGKSNDWYFERADNSVRNDNPLKEKNGEVKDLFILKSSKIVCGKYNIPQKDLYSFAVEKNGDIIFGDKAREKCGDPPTSKSTMTIGEAIENCQKTLIQSARNRGDADPSRASRDMDNCMALHGYRK